MRIACSLPALFLLLLLAGCVSFPPAAPRQPHYVQARWSSLPQWSEQDLRPSLQAFLKGCKAIGQQMIWGKACQAAARLEHADADAVRGFFEANFTPWMLRNADGSGTGLITGYYEPRLHGSRTPSPRYRYPIYGVPDDLLVIDLASLHPELKNLRLRGRLQGRRVVPYYSRAEIEHGHAPRGKELFWVDDPIGLFFLHVQGSGRIELPDGSLVKVGYADQNGHPYRSIGRKLIDMGELSPDEVSLQSIRRWARAHPDRIGELLASNPSYVFFRVLPDRYPGAVGALGVPLTAGYSLAVDRAFIPLGAPVYISTSWPNDERRPLNRLMMAQDTGGAIRGSIRADFFWGFGEQAGRLAGSMKQPGSLWLLLPRGLDPNRLLAARTRP